MTGFAVVSSRSSVGLYRDQRRWRIFFTLIRFSVLAGRLDTTVDPMPPVGGIKSRDGVRRRKGVESANGV